MKGVKITHNDRPDSQKTKAADMEAALIDVKVLAQLSADVGAELLPEIIDSYLSEIPARVEAITTAASLGNCSLVAKEAHPLKSSSAAIGAMQLADLAGVLESAGREQNLQEIEVGTQSLVDTYDRTRDALLTLDLENHESRKDAPENTSIKGSEV